jgi:hypothetical protein
MTIPTTAIDETAPAGSQKVNLGDNRIREYKVQNREILEVDHVYPSSGQDADNGKHKKVSLIEQADLGTGAEGKPILGAQTVGGKAELVFTDEDDNDIPLTSGGKLGSATTNILGNGCDLDGVLTSDDITLDQNNVYLKAKNAAGTGTVDLIKANASDVPILPDGTETATNAAPTSDNDVANKKYVDDQVATKVLGATASRNNNTTYQSATDGFFIGLITATTPTSADNWTAKIIGYSDANAAPTTVLGYAGIGSRGEGTGAGRTESNSFTIPVKSGHYYKGVASGANYTATYYWIPLGS